MRSNNNNKKQQQQQQKVGILQEMCVAQDLLVGQQDLLVPATPPPLELRGGETVRYMYTSVGKVGELEQKKENGWMCEE